MSVHSLFNVILLFYLLSFPLLLTINSKWIKGKNKNLNKSIKFGRKIHPFVGITLIVSGFIHGYLKMGGQFIFHTGSLLLIALILNGALGFYYKRTHNRKFAYAHRLIGFGILGLFALHYLNPWFFGF